jgi:hypothetical protein
VTEPQDAVLVETAEGASITPEIIGNKIDEARLKKAVLDALDAGDSEIDITEPDLYLYPEIYSDDPDLNRSMNDWNAYLNIEITYTFGDNDPIVVSNGEVTAEHLAIRHSDWVVGRINVLGALRTAGIIEQGKNVIPEDKAIADVITVTIIHADNLDVAFFFTDNNESNTNAFPLLVADGEMYYMHQNTFFGQYIADQWREIKATANGTNTIQDSKLNDKTNPQSKK